MKGAVSSKTESQLTKSLSSMNVFERCAQRLVLPFGESRLREHICLGTTPIPCEGTPWGPRGKSLFREYAYVKDIGIFIKKIIWVPQITFILFFLPYL